VIFTIVNDDNEKRGNYFANYLFMFFCKEDGSILLTGMILQYEIQDPGSGYGDSDV